jgi:hypothetical protein
VLQAALQCHAQTGNLWGCLRSKYDLGLLAGKRPCAGRDSNDRIMLGEKG